MQTMEDFDKLLSAVETGEPMPDVPPPEVPPNTDSQVVPPEQTEDTLGTGAEDEKAHHAFAKLRTEAAQAKDKAKLTEQVLAALAQTAGLDPALVADPAALLQQIQHAQNEQRAQELNIPVELLNRISETEQTNQQLQRQYRTQALVSDMIALKEAFALEQQDVVAFMEELRDQNINPMQDGFNLINAYKILHFDDLVAKMAEQRENAEAKKSAQKHASAPGKPGAPVRNTTGADGAKINTMAELDSMLKNMGVQL